jgi:hypothetical protein
MIPTVTNYSAADNPHQGTAQAGTNDINPSF